MTSTAQRSISFTAPEDCPDPALFAQIVAKEIRQHFKDEAEAAAAYHAYQQCRLVPEPFASNPDAAYNYQRALMALSPDAERWEVFDESLNLEFRDCEDDGKSKDPAIPGWRPRWISPD